jgi:hypothetical protein
MFPDACSKVGIVEESDEDKARSFASKLRSRKRLEVSTSLSAALYPLSSLMNVFAGFTE